MNRKNGKYGSLDLDALKAKLEGKTGPYYWRTLEEIADTDEVRAFLDDEFPDRTPDWKDKIKRRDVFRLMGASLALAGLTGCTRQPLERIVPYVKQPEEVTLGKPLFFATAMPFNGVAEPLIVESHLGRPTKIEGNPQHPASLGATSMFAQSSILDFWDPDRAQTVKKNGRISAWSLFLGAMGPLRNNLKAKRGSTLRFLSEPVTSPSLASQIQEIRAAYPEMQWHTWDPVCMGESHKAAMMAFGQPVNPVYHFDKATVVLSLASDFLCMGPQSVRYAHDFAAARRIRSTQDTMNRLYVVEPDFTATGGVADHRLPLRQVDMADFAQAIAARVGAASAGNANLSQEASSFVGPVANDLMQNKGKCVVIAGEDQPAAVQALAHAMNQALGNVGTTVTYTDPLEIAPMGALDSLRSLTQALNAGQVDALFIVGVNPVYDSPVDIEFASALKKAKFSAALTLYEDETAAQCQWHIPKAHYLESWGDARAYDGSVSIIQPLIAPLYDGRTPHELLAALTDVPDRSSFDVVREFWRGQTAPLNYDLAWRTALHDGFVGNTAVPTKTVAAKMNPAPADTTSQSKEGLEIVFRPDPAVWDGRFNNNAWLQELPKPMTKLTWDNAVIVSPATAKKLDVQQNDEVELEYQGHKVTGAIYVQPGQAEDSATVHLGYGRERAGRVGKGTGFNAYALRTAAQPWGGTGLQIRKTGNTYALASTNNHHPIGNTEWEHRQIVISKPISEYQKDPEFVRKDDEAPPRDLTLFPFYDYGRQTYAWGMSIDQTACVGCNACVIACVAENNISVVGKDQVLRGREMHWLRIDTYHSGDLHNPKSFYQPMLCQHCELAPCEPVCPVAATVHSSEGLNEMVYNRCVGTRYCSNNCPYKVRRFNFYLFADWNTPSLYGMRNPEVTVRSRGVMEKCTYCVQRIQNAKIDAEREGRLVRDGEIQTACEQACPTRAIIFGNINDRNSRVSKLNGMETAYGVISDLNTRPRTKYLARFRNPNPDIEKV